ncbi:MAG: hypothetical protein K8H85_10295 [Cyclobacteriaceae bacterium]|nr:hypothetical protein [Cyclobacteriaceae bacterium]
MKMKALHLAWTRSSALFMSSHQELEEELKRMKLNNKVPQEFIDKKDFQIESLVEYYNTTDELIQAYKMALSNARIENHFLTEMLCKKSTLQELMEYKPSLAVKLANMENGTETNISTIDGEN